MANIDCREAAFEAIRGASRKLSSSYFINQERYQQIDEICGLVDEITEFIDGDFECDSVTVYADTGRRELKFEIICDEIILERENAHTFLALARLVNGVQFSKAEPGNIRVEFIVSGLWCERIRV